MVYTYVLSSSIYLTSFLRDMVKVVDENKNVVRFRSYED